MRVPFAKAFWIIAALAVVVAVSRPGFRPRAELLRDKLAGEVSLPWPEVVVRLAPWSLQPLARDLLGPRAEPWARSLVGLDQSAGETGRVLLFEGPTAQLAKLNCHYSILAGGETPHPPHTHLDEEIILPLHGDVEIIRGEAFDSPDVRTETAGPGKMVFHASGQPHTIRAVGPGPSSYAVLRWNGRRPPAGRGLAAQTIDLQPHWDALASKPGPSAKEVVLDEPTALLPTLHVHLTRLDPGDESPEHVDEHDVALLTMEGAIETVDQAVGAESLVFLPAYKPHSMRNGGSTPARYVVVEFHGGDEN